MARFNVQGIEQTIQALSKMGQDEGPVADAMLGVAGKLVAEGWQQSLDQHHKRRTGALYRSIKPSNPKTVDGVRAVVVAPTGTDEKNRKKPVRNAEKGFVLNYGRKNMRGSHWAEKAIKATEGPAQQAMEKVWDAWLENGELPPAGSAMTASVTGVSGGGATYHQE